MGFAGARTHFRDTGGLPTCGKPRPVNNPRLDHRDQKTQRFASVV